jgi:hypothetical protein
VLVATKTGRAEHVMLSETRKVCSSRDQGNLQL